ncbi:hypothetical protein GGR52DRAFT_153933 [Hypoxylon sp. FL1284]|nr:hypothetical protein GGR52DRAFT_153933 [Hypoxylon sp. FL1284]
MGSMPSMPCHPSSILCHVHPQREWAIFIRQAIVTWHIPLRFHHTGGEPVPCIIVHDCTAWLTARRYIYRRNNRKNEIVGDARQTHDDGGRGTGGVKKRMRRPSSTYKGWDLGTRFFIRSSDPADPASASTWFRAKAGHLDATASVPLLVAGSSSVGWHWRSRWERADGWSRVRKGEKGGGEKKKKRSREAIRVEKTAAFLFRV